MERQRIDYRKKRQLINRGISALKIALALAIGGSLVVSHWDEIRRNRKIEQELYTYWYDPGDSKLTLGVNDNSSSDLRRTHTPDQINVIEQAASTVQRNCHITGASEVGPHREFIFQNSEEAQRCFETLRRLSLSR